MHLTDGTVALWGVGIGYLIFLGLAVYGGARRAWLRRRPR